ncbi:E3 ubiquitin-protein ligase TRIM39-like isoform X1 [Lissotriton helveticus]
MASAAQLGNLQGEASCSICLDYFTDPVMIDCGHNFCRSCITQSWEGSDENFPCPQCRATSSAKNLRPNRQLGNMVEMLKQFYLPPLKTPEENLCEKHNQAQLLFCAEDHTMICLFCREYKVHRNHLASPIEEAAEKHKDVSSTLSRWFRVWSQFVFYLVRCFLGLFPSLQSRRGVLPSFVPSPSCGFTIPIFSVSLWCNNEKLPFTEALMKGYKVMVTLDPDTTHPRLLLSEGGRRVRETGTAQPLPDTPKRFTIWPCVLGSEGFTSGRHYWEVQLLQERALFLVGVAAESVNRKGAITWSPEGGVWAVEGWRGKYKALASPETPLFPHEEPVKLGVYLDYEGGRLSLYNADSMELLYTFLQAPFTQRLFPFFCLIGAELRLV